LLSVEYDKMTQVAEMSQTLAAVYDMEEEKGHPRSDDFKQMCRDIGVYRIAYKNPAFAEEKEVRSLHLLDVVFNDGAPHLFDQGGTYLNTDAIPGQKVKYRTHNGALVAYVDIPLMMNKVPQPIKEVWLGPKNPNWMEM
jgi:hypothetical protein